MQSTSITIIFRTNLTHLFGRMVFTSIENSIKFM